MEKEKEAFDNGLLQFRSFDKHVRKALSNNEIIFGVAKNFNDPFDCQLPIDTNNTVKEISEFLHNANRNSKYSSDYIEQLAIDYFENKNKLEIIIRSQINDFRRFSCFHINSTDEIYENSLFWANYANNHKGICCKYDVSIINASKSFMVNRGEKVYSFPIEYSYDTIPYFNYLQYRIEKSKNGLASAIKLFGLESVIYFYGIKSKHWMKENEVRFVAETLNKLQVIEDYKNLKFNPTLLQKIYIGCNASQSTIDDVTKIMRLPKYKHVEMIQLIRDNKEFKFNEEKL